jgi:hypothetical protein
MKAVGIPYNLYFVVNECFFPGLSFHPTLLPVHFFRKYLNPPNAFFLQKSLDIGMMQSNPKAFGMLTGLNPGMFTFKAKSITCTIIVVVLKERKNYIFAF